MKERTCYHILAGDLCHKGYARINELETHESSYEHLHNRRLQDLRKDAWAAKKPKSDSKSDMKVINTPKHIPKVVPKKIGTGGWAAIASVKEAQQEDAAKQEEKKGGPVDPDDDFYGDYDPRKPTSCDDDSDTE
jgi:hypothetical protein